MIASFSLLLLANSLGAAWATQCDNGNVVTITEDILLSINDIQKAVLEDQPLAKISKDCAEPIHDFVSKDECATAAQAAVGLNLALEAFGITSIEQAATVIGQMIGESGGFQMSRNHYGTRQDGKDCSNGCALGQFGKGTFAMWPQDSLAVYAVTEGIVTQKQAVQLSGEEILALIMGPENPHAYGPDVWFLKYGQPILRSDFQACPKDFAEELDKGNLDPYKVCLARSDPPPAGAVYPDNYIDTLVKGMKKQNCEKWQPSKAVVMEYPAGVVTINEATVSVTPPISQPSMTTSVAGDWVYSGFTNTKAVMTTVTAIGGAAGGSDLEGDGEVDKKGSAGASQLADTPVESEGSASEGEGQSSGDSQATGSSGTSEEEDSQATTDLSSSSASEVSSDSPLSDSAASSLQLVPQSICALALGVTSLLSFKL